MGRRTETTRRFLRRHTWLRRSVLVFYGVPLMAIAFLIALAVNIYDALLASGAEFADEFQSMWKEAWQRDVRDKSRP